jgi:hypothetical protein
MAGVQHGYEHFIGSFDHRSAWSEADGGSSNTNTLARGVAAWVTISDGSLGPAKQVLSAFD